MIKIISIFLYFVHLGILFYFLFSSLYFLIFAIAGRFKYKLSIKKAQVFHKIAILIPAYREDAVIVETAEKACMLDYPSDLYDVFIAADQLKPETIALLKKTRAHVVELKLEKSSKAKALSETMNRIDNGKYEIAVILDADNIAENDFLQKINDAYESDCFIIQVHRTAKNLNTNFAILDAISEEINNHLFRKANRILGLPANLTGSGMAFPFKLFKELISSAKTSFEDKEIEFMLLEKGYCIEYMEDTYVFDEKIQNPSSFSRQRKRWVFSQMYYFRRYFFKSFPAFFRKNKHGLAFRAFSTALPPRSILLAFPLFFLILNTLLSSHTLLIYWLITFILAGLSIVLSVPLKFYNLRTIKALLSLPLAVLMMIKSIITAHEAKKGFLHTGHTGAKT